MPFSPIEQKPGTYLVGKGFTHIGEERDGQTLFVSGGDIFVIRSSDISWRICQECKHWVPILGWPWVDREAHGTYFELIIFPVVNSAFSPRSESLGRAVDSPKRRRDMQNLDNTIFGLPRIYGTVVFRSARDHFSPSLRKCYTSTGNSLMDALLSIGSGLSLDIGMKPVYKASEWTHPEWETPEDELKLRQSFERYQVGYRGFRPYTNIGESTVYCIRCWNSFGMSTSYHTYTNVYAVSDNITKSKYRYRSAMDITTC